MIHNLTNQFRSSRGDTIVEVLFAMAVIGLTIGVGYGISNRAIIAGRDAQERSESSKYVEAQLEKIILASSDPSYGIFEEAESTIYCLDDSLTIQDNSITPCNFGPEGRYTVTISRDDNLFIVTGTWQNIRSGSTNSASMVYRTYSFDNLALAVAPPVVVPPVVVPPLDIPSHGVVAGVSSATLNSTVSGSPVTRTITLTRLSSGTSVVLNVTSNSFNLNSLVPNETYRYTLNVTDASGGTFTTDPTDFPTLSPPSTLAPAPAGNIPPSGGNPGSRYYLSNSSVTCTQAMSEAALSGGHLVTIGSAAENTTVSTFAGTYIWIGYNDLTTEGSWNWVNGEAKVFEAWYDDPTTAGIEEPNNWPPGEDCAVMNWSQPGRWNDLFANGEFGYTARYVIEYEYN